jgi:DNA-binding MarR family transcriptional regulator
VPPSEDDVKAMVGALFTMNAGLERARRRRRGASILSLLQVVSDHQGIRPSEIAELQQVHPSLVTRQVRDCEDAGWVRVITDPADRRSLVVTLEPAGSAELRRLVEFGVKRFALFVDDWEPEAVRTLTALLERLRTSMARVSTREQLPARRRSTRVDALSD